MAAVKHLLTILYVRDLDKAKAFYDGVFAWSALVDLPNYVEYQVCDGARLGLMPQANAAGLLGELGRLTPTDGCPRAEIYVLMDDASAAVEKLSSAGAT
jgi:predicted enzyme related to lactoylglutathione lyase